MALFDDLKNKVTATAKNVAQKSGELVEITKLNMSISTEQEKINKVYAEIGAAVYNSYKAGNVIGFDEQCQKIKESEDAIAVTKQKILELKNAKTCSQCSSEISRDVSFCPKCGNNVSEED